MAPVNLLCTRFLKSLLVKDDAVVNNQKTDTHIDDNCDIAEGMNLDSE